MYHISDVKKYLRCPRLFWLSENGETLPFNAYVRLDEAVTTLACEKLGITTCFLGTRGDDPQKTLEAMKESEWIVKGRFEYKNLRVKIPFLHRNGDVWDVYFLYCGNRPKEDDMTFYCASTWVLKMNQIPLGDFKILHFDEDYVRQEDLSTHELFKISSTFYNEKGNPSKDIKEAIKKRMRNLEDTLLKMDEVLRMENVECTRQNKCTKKNKCRFYDVCFPQETQLMDDSILTLVSSQHKYAMKESGIEHLKDSDLTQVEGTRQQYAQIMASQFGGQYVDEIALKTWLAKIKFPITFLDFEWETYAIPPFKGMKPYDVLPFEYSIHILYQDGTIEHKEYIGTKDCRLGLVENLIKDVPQVGTVVAFNAEGAEKIRLKEMWMQFPQYEEKLRKIYSNMIDLSAPFTLGIVYDVRMRGFYSLKTIMSFMENQTGYQDLDIHQGMDAVFQWRILDRADEETDGEEIRRNLSAYCSMDTYAMLVVFEWLKSLVTNCEN